MLAPAGWSSLVIFPTTTLPCQVSKIPRQPFCDATETKFPGWFHLYYGFNGVAGFAPSHAKRHPNARSIWQVIVGEQLLNQNIFAFTLPIGRAGELTLGAYPDDFNIDSSIQLPIKRHTQWNFAWATSLESFTFGDDIYEDYSNGTAAFSTTDHEWRLPDHISEAIFEVLKPLWTDDGWFPCEMLDKLPSLTLGIGGRNVELKPEQYTLRREIDGDSGTELLCAMSICRPGDGYGNGTLGLGIPFFKSFVAAFDTDEEVIACKSRDKT